MAEQPTPEQLAEQIRALKVPELLVSTVATLGQLAFVKLEARDLDEARLAIDAVAALTPLLEGHADPELLRQLKQLLADVRLSFASAVPATSGASSPGHAAEGGSAAASTAGHAGESGSAAAATPAEPPGGAEQPAEPDTSGAESPGPVQDSEGG